jgi:hypothetical protein
MRLDLDGILHVTAIEKRTGLSKHVAISGATRPRDSAELARGKENIERLFRQRLREEDEVVIDGVPAAETAAVDPFGSLIETSPGENAASIGQPETPMADADSGSGAKPGPAMPAKVAEEAKVRVARCRKLIPSMHADDQEEAIGLIEDVETALADGDAGALAEASQALNEFLFFVEGR